MDDNMKKTLELYNLKNGTDYKSISDLMLVVLNNSDLQKNAADKIGISLPTLYRWIKKLNIKSKTVYVFANDN